MGKHDEEFTEFVVARRVHLFRMAYLLCDGDGHRAEDIVQQAFTKLYAGWHRISRVDSVDAYARRVVVNAHLDDVRRPWRRERPVDRLPETMTPAVDVEGSDALWTALRGLAPGQRRVVVLRHYLGLSVEETAADLGISPGTVKSQTSLALGNLRAALGPAEILSITLTKGVSS